MNLCYKLSRVSKETTPVNSTCQRLLTEYNSLVISDVKMKSLGKSTWEVTFVPSIALNSEALYVILKSSNL